MSDDGLHRTILDPIIPYVGSILGSLEPGAMIVIHGSVAHNADRFQIDFQCGSSTKPRSDVAFHFNPRFKGSGVLVCNTLQNEKWGWEEKTYEMPFKKGKPFEVIFLVLPNKFQVSSGGKHLLTYKHRINLERIDTLGISGMVQISTIGFAYHALASQSTSLALSAMNSSLSSMNSSQASNESLNFEIPYTSILPKALSPGTTVVVKGEICKNAKSFAINLKPSGSRDIALHLNPRMKSKVFVRNTYLYDSWGEEERQLREFPFFSDMYFEILIYCEAHQYKVAVNGQHLLEYKHRFKDLAKINEISVHGDVQLHDVRSW
ncbi:galectin-8 [Leptodactylus fuscus]|uniref:galectin-8 n=1 Tax=Leptodactylus fuscus TaxID=238119 RepID=UPI003F4EBA1D